MSESDYLHQLQTRYKAAWPAGLPSCPQYTKGRQPLTEYLRDWAQEQPDKPAIHFYGHDVSYAALDGLSDQFANLLIELGIQPGDRVAVYMPNCPQFHIAFYGILKCGGIYVPLSPMAKALELQHQLNDSTPRVVVCFDQLLPLLEPLKIDCRIEQIISTSFSELTPKQPMIPLPELFDIPKEKRPGTIDFYDALKHTSSAPINYRPGLESIAALNYTGGTTGLPKGCIHTHGNMLYTCASFLPCIANLEEDNVFLSFLPEFWIAGENTGLLFPVFSGGTLVLLARWDADAFLQAVQHYQVSACGVLVDSVAELLEHPRLAHYDLSSLRSVGCSSLIKKLTPEYREQWRALTGCTLFEGSYGMTETHTSDTFAYGFQENDFDLKCGPTFVGLPVPGTEFKVCDFDSGELVALGVEGELCIRSPSLFKGYWHKPEATEHFVRGGWFYTGDSGLITEEGFIRYLGRRKEMLKVNGMSVFPGELEVIISRHPQIIAGSVIGRQDPKYGQKPVAFIVLQSGASETVESLLDWCRDNMAVYKVPEIRIVEALPLTGTGKVKKHELAKLL